MRGAPSRRRRASGRLTAALILAAVVVSVLAGCTRAPSPAPTPELRATPTQLRGNVASALAVLAARAERGKKTLVVPRGMWTVTSTVLVPAGVHLRLENGAELRGDLPGAPVMRLTRGTVLEGGSITNTSVQPGFGVDFAAGTEGATVRDVRFSGRSVNAVYLDAMGLRDVLIERAVFHDVGYGVLLNPEAIDARGVTIEKNRFTGVGADAVEINAVTNGSAERVRDVRILGNRMSHFVGEGDSSGFGIGVAGGVDVKIRRNSIVGARNEAIHLEDGTTGAVVEGNSIAGGGTGDRPAVAVYRTTRDVDVVSNRIEDFAGNGVAILWDAMGSAYDVRVASNRISRVTGFGIVLAGDEGTGPFSATDNTLAGCRAGGVDILGSHDLSTVTGNVIEHSGSPGISQGLRGGGRTLSSQNSIVN